MKKIEKTFWVDSFTLDKIGKGLDLGRVVNEQTLTYQHKITITYEIPEKKVTISESEFDEIYNESLLLRGYCKALGVELKQKLFGGVE